MTSGLDSRPLASAAKPERRLSSHPVLLALGLAALGTWIYWPALHGGWIWDDTMYVPGNPAVRSLAGLRSIWFAPPGVNYFPVTFTVQWLQWHLWGTATFGYHVTNLVLHLLNGVLVGCLVQRLADGGRRPAATDGKRPFIGIAGSVAAFLFVAHPLAVESVAWISELKNVLSLAFLLGAMLAYVRYDEQTPTRSGAWERRRSYLLSGLLFILAMLSKSTVAMFPVVLLLYAWRKRGRIGRNDLLAAAPFAMAALGLGLVTIWFEHHRATALVGVAPESFVARLAVAGMGVAFYLLKCAVPTGLMPNYPHWDASLAPAWAVLAWGALAALTFLLWKKRSAWGRTALFAWGCFVANLAPVLGVIPMAYTRISAVADHFTYLSLIAVVGLAAGAGSARIARLTTQPGLPPWWLRPPLLVGLLVVLTCALAVESREYARIYRDEEAFWSFAAAQNPASWTAQSNLGLILSQSGRTAEAIARYETVLQLKPDDAAAHSNLASLLSPQPDRQAEVIAHYESALRLQPDLAGVHTNFAGFLAQLPERQADAVSHYETALRLQPDFAEAHGDLGLLLARLSGRQADAISHFEAALRLNPSLADVHNNLAALLASQPDRQLDAISHYESALRLNPTFAEAHDNLGLLLSRQSGRRDEAITHFETALRLNPDFAEAHRHLGDLLAAQPGRQDEAIAHYESALRLNPGFAAAHNNLGLLLATVPGRSAEAIAHFESALRLQPNLFYVHFNLARELAKLPDMQASAARHFAEALAIKPDFTPAREALQQLRRSNR